MRILAATDRSSADRHLKSANAAGSRATLLAVFSSHRWRRRPPKAAIAALLGVIGIAVAAYLVIHNRTADVHNGNKVEFHAPKPPTEVRTTAWPFYHLDLAHTAYLPAHLKPPFKQKWIFSGRVLMEFPPIVVDKSIYFMRNNGGVYRLDADTGKVKWKTRIGNLSAASPAYWNNRIFVSSLSGKIVALSTNRGRVLWQKVLPSRTESSPVVHDGVLYFGSESGELYALYAKTGRLKWKFGASGAIK